MLRITYKDTNKIESVAAFSPLYAYSFDQMVHNPKMSAGIGIVVKKFEIEQETAKMNKILDEMVKLRTLVYKVSSLSSRSSLFLARSFPSLSLPLLSSSISPLLVIQRR